LTPRAITIFIPQHFLKAWQHADGKNFRYRRLPSSNAMEIKSVSIKRTASIQDLTSPRLEDSQVNFPNRQTVFSGYFISKTTQSHAVCMDSLHVRTMQHRIFRC